MCEMNLLFSDSSVFKKPKCAFYYLSVVSGRSAIFVIVVQPMNRDQTSSMFTPPKVTQTKKPKEEFKTY